MYLSTTEHHYNVYPTTPNSKSVNSLDLLGRDGGQNRQLEGVAGRGSGGVGSAEGATGGLGVEFDKEQSRQRQRQRLEYGEGRTDNGEGYLGGGFGAQGEGHENQSGGSSVSTQPRGCWVTFRVPVLVSLGVLVVREGGAVWLL
ncbi:putative lachesin precursor-like [Homarus americanus]|uniref:Putative lachesin-like n=1 Tax=Homarus americanus TaxID=6706 RepID=A0A8J5JC04_HOMAM|nr:putative lachesin precursor-like [Homarus americanus]